MKIPLLTKRNQNEFFNKLKPGDIFRYSESSFLWDDVVHFANKSGCTVSYCPPGSIEYKTHGCFTGKVVNRVEENKELSEHMIDKKRSSKSYEKELNEQYLKEILNRRPSRWVNLTFPVFKRDITLLTNSFRNQESLLEDQKSDIMKLLAILKEVRDTAESEVHIESVMGSLDSFEEEILKIESKYN